jgi:hypothetical protein
MAYALENALFQWEEGDRRLRDAPELARFELESATAVVIDELRRRLGSSFSVDELVDLYAGGVDWALDLADRHAVGTDASWVTDAAFHRYAREATDYSGGRTRPQI